MSETNTPAARRFRNAEGAASHFMVTAETLTNWHHRGYIRGYRIEGVRGIQFDLDEIERAFKVYGPSKMRDGRRRGAKGRVVAVVVAEGGDQ
ncbi:hypothetical protein LJR042_002866 [Microbacterium maritypicum]|uniref:hypothetical protein n=1 Tax=Microbacterium TaxID=33882 RepID=UPI00141FB55F|nr:hypothetical protein [Microbacterium sp. Be9]NIG66158.1 hypothetical protein [Microbacterium sp. Be9]